MSTSWPLEGTTPLIADRFIETYIAAVSLQTIGLFVELTADNTVNVTTGPNSKKVVGVTLTKALAGQKISVVSRGKVRVVPYATLTYGDQVCATSGGTALTDNSSLNTTILGICSQGGNSAGTAIVELW
ncbi:MAG: hypothetical protein WCD81_07905 [Candidatus Bathyarchaeia archaeon]